MKTNESKWHKYNASLLRNGTRAWKLLQRCTHRGQGGNQAIRNAPLEEQPIPFLKPLDRIKGYLLQHGLSRQVHVRFDGAGDFVLEDDDGLVRAKDYDKAVALIKRTWL